MTSCTKLGQLWNPSGRTVSSATACTGKCQLMRLWWASEDAHLWSSTVQWNQPSVGTRYGHSVTLTLGTCTTLSSTVELQQGSPNMHGLGCISCTRHDRTSVGERPFCFLQQLLLHHSLGQFLENEERLLCCYSMWIRQLGSLIWKTRKPSTNIWRGETTVQKSFLQVSSVWCDHSSIPSAIHSVGQQWNARRRMAPQSTCPARYLCSCTISTWGKWTWQTSWGRPTAAEGDQEVVASTILLHGGHQRGE